MIDAVEVLRYPLRTARKVVGRLRRNMTAMPESGEIRLINGAVRFEHKKLPFLNDEDMRAMLTASYDIVLCEYLEQHLKAGDVVLDAGANVGYISAVAASCVGKSGAVHGFEPLPECFARLQTLRGLNPDSPFFFNRVALGERPGILPIAYDPKGESTSTAPLAYWRFISTYRRSDTLLYGRISRSWMRRGILCGLLVRRIGKFPQDVYTRGSSDESHSDSTPKISDRDLNQKLRF
jgi:hypothetical protein